MNIATEHEYSYYKNLSFDKFYIHKGEENNIRQYQL